MICCSRAARTEPLQPWSSASVYSQSSGEQPPEVTATQRHGQAPPRQQQQRHQQAGGHHTQVHGSETRQAQPGVPRSYDRPAHRTPSVLGSTPVDPEAACPIHHYKGQCKGLKGCIWCINKYSPVPGSDGVCIAVEDAWELPIWTYTCLYDSSTTSTAAERPTAT